MKIPLEPRHVVQYAAWDDAPPQGPIGRALSWLTGKGQPPALEGGGRAGRRGPRLAPTAEEALLAMGAEERGEVGPGGGLGAAGVGGGEETAEGLGESGGGRRGDGAGRWACDGCACAVAVHGQIEWD